MEFGPNDTAVAVLIPSESRGVAIPHQLGNSTQTGDTGFVPTPQTGIASTVQTNAQIGAAEQTSYTQGTGITQVCGAGNSLEGNPNYFLNASADIAHKGGVLSTGVNASDQAINNVVRVARA